VGLLESTDPAEPSPEAENLTVVEALELRGGATAAEGNLYVNQQPVCDDGWSEAAAGVVCRMLNFSQALAATERSHFGLVPTEFILSNLVCSGEESSIINCTSSPSTNCAAKEGAGVICLGDLISPTDVKVKVNSPCSLACPGNRF
jgi:hypothetical protein